MSLNEKMTALADAVRSKANRTDSLSIDAMTAAVNGLAVGTPSTKSLTVTPTKSAQTFSSSDLGVNTYYSTVTVNAIPGEYITTNDATATALDILEGETAYVNGSKVTGRMTNHGRVVAKVSNIHDKWWKSVPGYYESIEVGVTTKSLEVTPSKSKQVFNVLNEDEDVFYDKVTVYPIPAEYVTTTDATVTAADLLYGVTAYGKDGKVTGNISTVTAIRDANVITVPRGFIAQEQVLIVEEMPAVSVQGNSVSIAAGYNSTPQSITVGTAKAAETFTPGVDDVIIPADSYLTGSQIIKGDNNLRPENIAKDITIFGVTGDFEGNAGIDTSAATVTPSDLLAGVTAYGANGLILGNIETVRPSVVKNTVTLPKGYVNEDQTITVGTYVSEREYTPGTADITIPADAYLAGAQTIKGDGALISENIRAGVSIFNVSGSFTADANATSSDIASGKTAYVNGELVVGTASGGEVVKLWRLENSGNFKLSTPVFASKNMSIPSCNSSYTFICTDGKIYNYDYKIFADTSINWRYAVTNTDTSWCHAISDSGELYYIYYGTKNENGELKATRLCPDISGITQVMLRSMNDRALVIANGDLYLTNYDHPEYYARVQYEKEKETDPTVYVRASNVLNVPQSDNYETSYVITEDGSLAVISSDTSSTRFDEAFAKVYPNDAANGNRFLNYRPLANSGDYGSEAYYELAFRTDGLWYRTPGFANIDGKWQPSAWSKANDPGLIKTNFLGYCNSYAEEDWSYDETTGEESWSYSIVEATVALHIDEQHRLWKIAVSGAIDGNNVTYNGISLTQVGEDSDWDCVPPVISSGDRNKVAQKSGKLIKLYANRNSEGIIELTWAEFPFSPPGKLIANTNDVDLFFAKSDVFVDLSIPGGSY